jgi:hypothetical protein
MIRIVCFKWKPLAGQQQPSVEMLGPYGPETINYLYQAFKKYLRIPHEFVCITDDPEGIDKNVRIIPLWDKCLSLGRCYNRLYVFSKDMRDIIGPRFATVDIDCVVTGDLTPIFDREGDFWIHEQQWRTHVQPYNGSLVIMDAGARDEVWTAFKGQESIDWLANNTTYVGSDQAWIANVLKEEKTLNSAHGIYEEMLIKGNLPPDARLVFFSGNRDPRNSPHAWVKNHLKWSR